MSLLRNYFLFFISVLFLLSSLSVSASYEGVIVNQPKLEIGLRCDNTASVSLICLSSIIWHESPGAYIYKFKIKSNYNELVRELININIRQVSSQLNPLTARFYNVEPLLIDKINQEKYSANDIIVSFDIDNGGDRYTAFIYPRLIDGKIKLYYDFLDGEVDVYSFLVNKCDKIKNIKVNKDTYNDFCVYTN